MNEFFTPFIRSGSSKVTIKMKIVKASSIFLLRAALFWEKQQIQQRVKQGQQEIFVYDILMLIHCPLDVTVQTYSRGGH
jgi:uncharacterized membrane protein YqhA